MSDFKPLPAWGQSDHRSEASELEPVHGDAHLRRGVLSAHIEMHQGRLEFRHMLHVFVEPGKDHLNDFEMSAALCSNVVQYHAVLYHYRRPGD